MRWLLPFVLWTLLTPASGRADDAAPVDIVSLRDGIWMLRTNTPLGNPSTVVATGSDGVLVVDPNFRDASAPLLHAISELSPRPIRWIVTTHHHGDHSEGLETFPSDAIRLAPDGQLPHLRTGAIVAGERPIEASSLPHLTFRDRVTLELGGITAELIALPAGHTDGDTVVWFPDARVLVAGDHLFLERFPIIDVDDGGDLDGYLANMQWMIDTFPEDTLVVPGHGTFPPDAARAASLDDLRAELEALRRSIDIVRGRLAAGLDGDAIVAAGLPSEIEVLGRKPRYVSTERWLQFLTAQITQ